MFWDPLVLKIPFPVILTGLSSDSGLGGSSDGSSDVLAFSTGSVVDSVTEEGRCVPLCLHVAHHPNTLEGFNSLSFALLQRLPSPRSPAVRLMEKPRHGAWQMYVSCILGCWHTKPHALEISLHWLQRWPTELKSTGLMQQTRARHHWCRLC